MPNAKRPMPTPNKKPLYLIRFRGTPYYHRGLWPKYGDALRNASDLAPDGVTITRCWVAPEK